MASSKKEPYELYPEIWKSKTAFFTYLRGAIRSVWSRYPAKLEWKKQQLIDPPKGYIGRAKKLGKCHYCSEMFPASKLEVDHVEMAGSCNSWETANQFLYKLLDCNDNWVLACKPCHKCKSLAERKGISFEEAFLQKRVIQFLKEQSKSDVILFLTKRGYSLEDVSNGAKRRVCVEKELRKEV